MPTPLRVLQRAPLRRTLAAAALTCLAAACVSPPTAEELLAVGFRSPEQAFATYQTAMAGDHLDLEYRCLSQGFRDANGIDGMVYRLAREELFRRQPFVKLLAEGEVVRSTALGPDRHELVVEVGALWIEEHVRVLLGRSGFYETRRGERLAFDAFAPFDEHVFVEPGQDGAPDLVYAIVPVPAGEDAADLTELRLGQEWRIAGLELLPDIDEPASTGSPRP